MIKKARQNKVTNDYKTEGNHYLVFFFTGIAFVLISIIFFSISTETFEFKAVCAELFLNLGISILAVVLVQYIWQRRGRDPIMKAIVLLRKTIKQLEEFNSSGLTSVKSERRKIDQDNTSLLCELLKTATSVDMMAFTLSSQIAKRDNVIDSINKLLTLTAARFV